MNIIEILLLLIVGHALADYPLQGDFLAKAKNHKIPIQGVPWYQALFAHSVIHGGMVALITGYVWLGIAEFILHSLIDYEKSDMVITYNQDQALHLVCKLLWVFIIYFHINWNTPLNELVLI